MSTACGTDMRHRGRVNAYAAMCTARELDLLSSLNSTFRAS
jgi:hypothetical protein